jgi:hypothetical protein
MVGDPEKGNDVLSRDEDQVFIVCARPGSIPAA